MATWVLTATNLPLTSAPGGELEGDIPLTGAMPIDFDPDGITEIRLARTLATSASHVDDTIGDNQSIQLKNSNGESVASYWGATVNRTSSGSWEYARTFNPPFTATPTSGGNYLTPPTAIWSTYSANMKTDNATTSITAITCEIDYVPLVPAPPTVSVSASDTEVFVKDIVTFTAARTGKPTPALTWQHDGVQYGSTSDPLVRQVYWTSPGTKTVTVTATNDSGSVQDSVQVEVAIKPLPDPTAALTITSTGPYESGVTPVQLGLLASNPNVEYDTGNNTATATVNWGDGTPDFVTNYYNFDEGPWVDSYPSHVYTTAGTFTITLTVERTGLNPASAQDTAQVEIIEPAAAPKLAEFIDDFSTLDMSKWSGHGTFNASTGRAVATIDGVFYAWAQTLEIYDARNSEIIIQAGAPDIGSGGREHTLSIGYGGWSRAVKMTHIGDGVLAITTVDSVNTVVAESYSIPQVAWWRIRFTSNSATFGWSADRAEWFDFHTAALDWLATHVRVEIATGAWQAEGTFSGWWDNVNAIPAASGIDVSFAPENPVVGEPIVFTVVGEKPAGAVAIQGFFNPDGSPISTQRPDAGAFAPVTFATPGPKTASFSWTDDPPSEMDPPGITTVNFTVAEPEPEGAFGEIFNGTSWKTPEIWNGTRWVTGPEAQVWNGTAWVPLGHVPEVGFVGKRNTFVGIPSGQAVTVENSGGESGDAFDAVVLGVGSSVTALGGSQGITCTTGGANREAMVRWNIDPVTSDFHRFYLRSFAANPTAIVRLVRGYSGSTIYWEVRYDTSGRIVVVGGTGGWMVATAAALSLATVHRVEVKIGLTQAECELRVYPGDGDVPLATEVFADTVVGAWDNVRFGHASGNTPVAVPVEMKAIAWSPIDWIGAEPWPVLVLPLYGEARFRVPCSTLGWELRGEYLCESPSDTYAPDGGRYAGTSYYESNGSPDVLGSGAGAVNADGYGSNGNAPRITPLNQWVASSWIYTNGGGGTVAYIDFRIVADQTYVSGTMRVRNLEFWADGALQQAIPLESLTLLNGGYLEPTGAAPVASFTATKNNGSNIGSAIVSGQSYTEPLRVLFTSTSTGDISSYAWDFGASSVVISGNVNGPGPIDVEYFGSASRTPSLTVTGPGGSDTESFAGTIVTVGGGAP